MSQDPNQRRDILTLQRDDAKLFNLIICNLLFNAWLLSDQEDRTRKPNLMNDMSGTLNYVTFTVEKRIDFIQIGYCL